MTLVLVVDDDPTIRELVAFALGIVQGIEVATAPSSGDALSYLHTHAPPDVALLDVMMPGTDGLELLRDLRRSEKFSALPVILMTAASHRIDQSKARALGACGVIPKPFDPLTLAREVLAMIDAAPGPDHPKGRGVQGKCSE